MLNRRDFLKIGALAGAALLPALPRVPESLRVLLPVGADLAALLRAASSSGLRLLPAFYPASRPPLHPSHPQPDLVSLPLRSVAVWIAGEHARSLPPDLDAARFGPAWAAGKRPHDPENRFSLPHTWGTADGQTVWAFDWVIPALASPAAERLLAVWAEAQPLAVFSSPLPRVNHSRYRLG